MYFFTPAESLCTKKDIFLNLIYFYIISGIQEKSKSSVITFVHADSIKNKIVLNIDL
jgi:hypothetical protein